MIKLFTSSRAGMVVIDSISQDLAASRCRVQLRHPPKVRKPQVSKYGLKFSNS